MYVRTLRMIYSPVTGIEAATQVDFAATWILYDESIDDRIVLPGPDGDMAGKLGS
jgi:hypothetical protein